MKKIILLFLLFSCTARQDGIEGNVTHIADGDTFTMLTADKTEIKVRLYGIDCPERGQDFSRVARQFLHDLIAGTTVTVQLVETDRYGRTVGIVSTQDGRIVNEELLNAGLAWHYKQHDNNMRWALLEEEARATRTGLWSLDNPTPPWVWRKRKRKP